MSFNSSHRTDFYVVNFFLMSHLKRFRFKSESELGKILPKERFRIMITI